MALMRGTYKGAAHKCVDDIMRWIGVFSILLCAFTILAAVYQRIASAAAPAIEHASRSVEVRFCPNCGAAVDEASQGGECEGCGARYRVVFDA